MFARSWGARIALALAVALPGASTALAQDTAVGDDWKLRVPEGFGRAPEAVEAIAGAATEILIEKSEFPCSGETEMQVFIREGLAGPEAVFVVMRFDMDGEVPSVASCSLDEITGCRQAIPGLPHGMIEAEKVFVGSARALPAISVSASLPTPDGVEHTARLVLIPRRDFLLAVSLQAEDQGDGDWEGIWDETLASIEVSAPAPGTGMPRWLLFAIIGGVIGGAGGLVAAFLRRRRGPGPTGAVPLHSGRLGESSGTIRAVDGLPTYGFASTVAPAPVAAAVSAPPAPRVRPISDATRRVVVRTGSTASKGVPAAGPAPERTSPPRVPAPRSDASAADPSESAEVPPRPAGPRVTISRTQRPAAGAARSPADSSSNIKIQRNRDFLAP